MRVPDELAEDLLALSRRTMTPASRLAAGFDPPIVIEDGANAFDRLLAFTGRNPAVRTPLR